MARGVSELRVRGQRGAARAADPAARCGARPAARGRLADMSATADPAPTSWPAPAKLNLFLHVTGRRADGYHELQTLFQLIELCDTITISVREDGRIERLAG